ncbi:hypothetical protein IPV08_23000 [Methylobacterium sp. SD274]|uniref:hypothetical protein n=1 Tax=Methylobacterium sp. SD274 TaxID=2782009 RepID=UPI001A9596E6|nr:hypothetical protein [Methylobacterium sp. SD274]MBO1022831.1 hypothetical protein [Methylobacterium sp. SD274]
MATGLDKFKKTSPSKTGLGLPPAPEEVRGNVRPRSVADLVQERRAEADAAKALEVADAAAEAEAVTVAADEAKPAARSKKPKGRPKLDYDTRQLGARVSLATYDRMQAITKRERVGLGPLVDRMVAAWEEQRLSQAEALGPRLEGEDDDIYIARVFRL